MVLEETDRHANDVNLAPTNNASITETKGFTVVHLNARSLKKKFDEIIILINTLRPDIFTISETWLNCQIESSPYAIEGYSLHRADRILAQPCSNSKGGGLITLIKLPAKINSSKYEHLNASCGDIEVQVIFMHKEMNKSTVIINIYRPPSGDLENFENTLLAILQEVCNERYADIYLLGDFNLNHDTACKTKYTTNLETAINLHGLTQIIDEPTRVTLTTATLIDVIYVKTSQEITPFVKKVSLSDHYMVGSVRKLNYAKDPTTYFYGRSYRRYNYDIAKQYYTTLNKQLIYQMNDPNLVWTTLKKYITNCVLKYCPIRKIVIKVSQPAWITKEVLEILNDKDLAFREAYLTQNE